MNWTAPAITAALDRWLDEDLGRGDLSAVALVSQQGSACWTAKQSGRFCGGPLVARLFGRLDPAVQVRCAVAEGAVVEPGQVVLSVEGPAAALVSGERTALNLAMRLSGIATATAELVEALAGSGVQLADTRKTTPGLRVFEKYAVRCGGGVNHRMGLDDAAMLKENHLAWAGGMAEAIAAVRGSAPWPACVIVEAETAEQAEQAVRSGADGVLLDEFMPEQLQDLVPRLRREAAAGQRGAVVLEASGVNPASLAAYRTTGIDLISTSAPITRSAWLDLSMRYE